MKKTLLPPKSLIKALDELKDGLYQMFYDGVLYTEGLTGYIGFNLYRQVYTVKPNDFDRIIKYLNKNLELAENKSYYYTTLYVHSTDPKFNGSQDAIWYLVAVVRPYQNNEIELELNLLGEPSGRRR